VAQLLTAKVGPRRTVITTSFSHSDDQKRVVITAGTVPRLAALKRAAEAASHLS
jgi:hypothetical protein